MTACLTFNAIYQALRVSTCLVSSDHQRIVISSLYTIYNFEPCETGQLKMGEVYESLYDQNRPCYGIGIVLHEHSDNINFIERGYY